MSRLRAITSGLWLVLCLWACESPIVGLECRQGFTLCGNTCVDPDSDFRHCGMCDHSCGRFVCEKGSCSSNVVRDAGPNDGGGGSGGKDAGPRDAGREDDGGGFDPDAGLPGCGVGYQDCGGVCADPTTDPNHCGSCGVACPGRMLCSAGTCAPECDKALSQCGALCIDAQRDPDHCGRCTKRCTSGICELGSCADAIAGHAVVIGHDFTNANTAMQRLVGNAVFLGLGAPVRVLVYTGDADPKSSAGVERAIDVVKVETGRDWQRVEAIESLVPLQLSAADVLLIHAQVEASNSTLRKLGEQWGNALAQFVSIGGVVIVIDAPSTRNNGTFQILQPARIFLAKGRQEIESQPLTVKTPGLGVAMRVPDRYMGLSHTVHFNAVTSPGTQVVTDRDGLPVVVQRVISPR
ncbi:MAG TPA: hypothetical protein VFN67_08135 [Polyangiales bacterium]|nr:hypothetical protein [Polyangiales bacterium]